MGIPVKKALTGLLAIAAVVLCSACQQRDALDQIRHSGELRVVTRNGPTTYFQDRSGPTGFEYALALRLAEDLEVDLSVQPQFNLDGIFRKLRRREADLAAAGLTLTGQRMMDYPHSGPYYELTPQVVYIAGTYRPRNLEDLLDMSIAVLAHSSHASALLALKNSGYESLNWLEVDEADSTELLELVLDGEVQLALIDSNEFKVLQPLYPRLRVAFDLGAQQQLGWFLAPGADNGRLIERIDKLFSRLTENGEMARLRKQFFEQTKGVTRMGSHTFSRNVRKKLPQYRELIQQVAQEYQMDWELLAAISYQESHWNPLATSATGVRGMMMLTLPTARELGVENRLDPLQSLRGGARYLKNIKRRLPQDIYEPDLTWFAMAAYNVGMGHLEDARVITQRQGGDPHLWADVKERLPLLQKSKYYQNTRYGYARGSEPVTYVKNIRHYYSILQWQDINENKARPPLELDTYIPGVLQNSRLSAL
jgi:peptidoglycan lytic transglycosylase F